MPRTKHIRILELIEGEGIYSFEEILKELLAFLPTDTIDDFFETSFRNVGLEPETDQE